MLVSIQKILPGKIFSLGLKKDFEFLSLQKNWGSFIQRVLGPAFQQKSFPLFMRSEVLVVDCLDSVWASEFQIKKEAIRRSLQAEFKEIGIEQIRFIS